MALGQDLRASISIGDRPIGMDELRRAWARPLRVQLSQAVRTRIGESRRILDRLASGPDAVYGVNTGVGQLCRQRIPQDQLARLQHNLIVSHAVGVGPPMPAELVRWMIWFKLEALARGFSGIQPTVTECLCALLNADCLPVVPNRGSLGASGDLAPLAHLALPLIGLGAASFDGAVLPGAEALRRAGIQPVSLGPKDGLALINGTQFMTAYAAAIAVRAAKLARLADVAAAMSLEALRGSVRPFDQALIELRPHPGALAVAENIRSMMRDSQIVPSHANCGKVQDPYSLRCVPQVHGACRDALTHATDTVLREINSVTDNPVIFESGAVSGGNFHGEPIALVTDYLAMALTEWGNVSERRTYLLLSGHDGLPTLLLRDTGINSGLMLPQYTAAALLNECKVLSHPAATDSIPTSLGQEDHVSMGGQSVLKCWQIIENAETILAVELFCAAQALDFRAPLRAGRGPAAAHECLRRHVSHADTDRVFGDDLRTVLRLVQSDEILDAVEAAVGTLH